MSKANRGFASMDKTRQKEIASLGGKAAHVKGTAHQWTSTEAREAGRKGGLASGARKRTLAAQPADSGSVGVDSGSPVELQ